MKKSILAILLAASCLHLSAQEKKEIVKTGLNFGPLPAIAFDADKGFQYGAILQIFNYGDGHNYPNYDSKIYLETSFYTKGSQLYQMSYDNKELIPGVRWSTYLRANLDKAFDFYGFNGYESYYAHETVASGKAGDTFLFSPFYKMKKYDFTLKSDFLGRINDKVQWEAGIFAKYQILGSIDRNSINKGKSESEMYPDDVTTLYDIYTKYGIIGENEKNGGFSSGIRLGMVYDTRDKEGAPTSGIWAEGHVTLAPSFISNLPYYRYSFTWRQYFPIISNDVLTFAYRLNYEGNFGKDAPWYALPYMTYMGEKNDSDGMGGYHNLRGVMRDRVVGQDMAVYTAELRWRFLKFRFANQNIAFGLNAFSDGAIVTRGVDLSKLTVVSATPVPVTTGMNDKFHSTVGAGFRFIMNENFIVAAEYGTPVSHFMKNSPIYNQDGTGAFYINLGYLF